MCGIAGLCNRINSGLSDIERMKDRIIHRGPDAEGTWAEKDCSVILGHRRLSILDLSEAGVQPMLSHSGRMAIAFNGEIYNHRRLQKHLEEKGLLSADTLRGTSDTEILLEALEHLGVEETLQFIKGMFAFALYDRIEKKLWLSRDRVGEKPLYYGFVKGSFAFASEIGCIAALPDFDAAIDRKVLGIYMVHGYIPAPYSIYEGIYKLEPGKVLCIEAPFTEDTMQIRTYWSMQETALYGTQHPFQGSFAEASEELERLLSASIQDQMIADVPLGAFLSAGIDSSTIVSLMQKIAPGKVKTFTIGMENEAFNEARIAKEIAAHLGTEHTEIYISEKEAKEALPLLPGMFGEPFADSSQIPTWLVSRMTRKHVTVALSGDAGDELFGGYTTYETIPRAFRKTAQLPYGLRQAFAALMMSPMLEDKAHLGVRGMLLSARTAEEMYAKSDQAEPVVGRIVLEKETRPHVFTDYPSGLLPSPEENLMLMDLLMYHPDDILVKVDRTAMAVSLETRVPMLDRDVVEFAWTLPLSMKRRDGRGKLVLRDILYRYVPQEMMERPKKGFGIPIAQWLQETQLRDWMLSLLDEKKIAAEGYFDAAVVHKLVTDYTQRGIWRKQLWFLLQFEAWLETRG